MKKHKLNIIPSDKDLWEGIAGHFTSLSQVIEELVDNSYSNFRANSEVNHNSVFIHFDTLSYSTEDKVVVTIEDTGTGILEMEKAFTIGNREARETILNEHGFGLKHALASANPKNDSWQVYTRRVNEVSENEVITLKSPYRFKDFSYEVVGYNDDNYPSKIGNTDTGTIIRFTITRDFFNTMGRHGSFVPTTVLAHLHEDLGFVYSKVISDNEISIRIQLNDDNKEYVSAVIPKKQSSYVPHQDTINIDLGKYANDSSSGEIRMEYEFMIISKREETKTGRIKPVYYVESQKSQGVEIRLNGRMIENNIMWDIWGVEKHNSHNKFLAVINLISDNHDALPKTRSSKNGFRRGDPKLVGLFSWIRKKCEKPYEYEYDRKGSSLIKQLKNHYQSLEERLPGIVEIQDNMVVLRESGEYVEIDLTVKFQNNYILFLTKKHTTKATDLYHLKFYWDALIIEGIQPTEAVLISVGHGELMDALVTYNNNLKDGNGKNYNFKLKLWKDENIQYPPLER